MVKKPKASARETFVAQSRYKDEESDVSATFYIPRPTHKVLRRIALDRDTSLQQILVEATDRWLKANGEGPFYPPGDRRAAQSN
ncbi:MAG: hypothetical protein ACKVP3_23745 [Hyphomicrobiaceae bacterium]